MTLWHNNLVSQNNRLMTQKKQNLLNSIKQILKDVRFGNLSGRLLIDNYPDNIEFANDFNNMLEAIEDREAVLKEYHNFYNSTAEHLKSLFNMLNDGAMTLSEDLTVLSANDMQLKWFRKARKKIVGKNLLDLLKPYKITDYETNATLENHKDFFKKDKKNCILCFEIKKIKMFLSISIKKFHNQKDETNYFVISKDISNDINLQKLKNTFIATLTHDLKVPILAEKKVLELLNNETFGQNTPMQKEAIENMRLNNTEMMDLVSTLLDVYKIEEGAFHINKSVFNPENLILKIAEKLKFIIEDSNLKIKFNFSGISEINADKKEISRVLNNIITNACDFAPQNSEIIIKTIEESGNIKISITDYGSGIEQDKLPHIFERYYTCDKKYRKVGTGLGLYLSKKIVDMHGGDILVSSSNTSGTIFTIILPIK